MFRAGPPLPAPALPGVPVASSRHAHALPRFSSVSRQKDAMRCVLLAAWVLGLVLVPGSAPRTERFTVRPDETGNRVEFVAHATLETFRGTTNAVEGYVEIIPGDVGDTLTVRLRVDMASLDTGISLRNKHMREKHLETDEYPTATFEGATILGPVPSILRPGETIRYVVAGTMTLHGVARRLRARVALTLNEENDRRSLHVVADFPVHLDHYRIKQPRFLFVKVDKVQRVTLDVVAHGEPADEGS